MPINPLGYSCIKELQRDNLLHAYNEPINIYSAAPKVIMGKNHIPQFFQKMNKNPITIQMSHMPPPNTRGAFF